MKKSVLVLVLICILCVACASTRKDYGDICGIPIYSEPTNNLTMTIQEALMNGEEIKGAYEENGEVVFIYEEEE